MKKHLRLWNGKPLKEIEVQAYAEASGIRPVMRRQDYNALDKSAFTNLGTDSTGNQGIITFSNLHRNDNVTFVFTGHTDTVYSQTIVINDDSPQTIAVDMPSKGEFETELLVAANAVNKWVQLFEKGGKFEAFFYYRLAKNDKTAGTFDNRQVKDKSNGFTVLNAEPTHEGDDRMYISVDLRDMPIQSYFIFLVTVKYYEDGTEFVMYNTADEITPPPITIQLE